ncbi:MAG: chromosome partitioning ATPase [Rhodospirillales bacterium]|nr:chromosome partitioning ATPase [Rhodospirillales bacterium]
MADSMDLIERAAARLKKDKPQTLADMVATFAPKPEQAPAPSDDHVAAGPEIVTLDARRMAAAGLLDWSDEGSAVIEELRVIKRRLVQKAFAAGSDPRLRLMLVTSTKPKEGKTFVATNLALSMSVEEDYGVLLIEADTKRRTLERNLGVDDRPGLIDLIADPTHKVADLVLRTNIPKLSILPAGRTREQTSELFASRRMREVVDELSRLYRDRIIIFDGPPCLASSDPQTLSGLVGQVLFVIEAGMTQQAEIEAGLGLLSCPDISLLLNKSEPSLTRGFGNYAFY